jgi:phosphoribosylaminoimidazole-succinocarboxamide synthase
MANGFMGKEGQQVPEMSESWIREISDRYIELYEGITGEKFVKAENGDILHRIETNVLNFLSAKK